MRSPASGAHGHNHASYGGGTAVTLAEFGCQCPPPSQVSSPLIPDTAERCSAYSWATETVENTLLLVKPRRVLPTPIGNRSGPVVVQQQKREMTQITSRLPSRILSEFTSNCRGASGSAAIMAGDVRRYTYAKSRLRYLRRVLAADSLR